MVMAPKGTPESITSKLGQAIKQVLQEERLVEQFRLIGAEPEFVDAAQLATMLSVERDKVGAVMKSLPPATP
jgi:tripartite-type tricarboxylate transporter receptor subunit TctC